MAIVALTIAGATTGCVGHISPPSDGFPAPTAAVRAETERMRMSPQGLDRPLVLIAGWRGTGANIASMAARLKRLTGASDEMILTAAQPLRATVGGGADAVIDAVERRWPSDDPNWTREVDVVGYSIGGVLARVAAAPRESDRKRLRIRTLYTLATPHTGTHAWGRFFKLDPSAWQVRGGSELLDWLNEQLPEARYGLVCYAALGDGVVGATNASPPGIEPIWTVAPGRLSHLSITHDLRVLGDIALRLRGEAPLQPTGSPAPRD